jgi:hypothetical protein
VLRESGGSCRLLMEACVAILDGAICNPRWIKLPCDCLVR